MHYDSFKTHIIIVGTNIFDVCAGFYLGFVMYINPHFFMSSIESMSFDVQPTNKVEKLTSPEKEVGISNCFN